MQQFISVSPRARKADLDAEVARTAAKLHGTRTLEAQRTPYKAVPFTSEQILNLVGTIKRGPERPENLGTATGTATAT